MCYHIISQASKVISRCTVHRVTNIELSADEFKETFVKFDTEIYLRIKADNRRYEVSKPSPQDWADMLEEDPDFSEEFQTVFNDADIPEEDNFTPEVLEDTYVDMEIEIPRDGEGPDFAKVIKRLRDSNVIPIVRQYDNPMLV